MMMTTTSLRLSRSTCDSKNCLPSHFPVQPQLSNMMPARSQRHGQGLRSVAACRQPKRLPVPDSLCAQLPD